MYDSLFDCNKVKFIFVAQFALNLLLFEVKQCKFGVQKYMCVAYVCVHSLCCTFRFYISMHITKRAWFAFSNTIYRLSIDDDGKKSNIKCISMYTYATDMAHFSFLNFTTEKSLTALIVWNFILEVSWCTKKKQKKKPFVSSE